MSLSGIVFSLFTVCFLFSKVNGHGYMLIPTNRASLWRVDWTQPPNYNDNEYFCGGTYVQYYVNHGRCGPCGDDFRDPVPRSNENTGKFGNGLILTNYSAGSVIKVTSIITANHLGSLYFHICELENPDEPETEACFRPLRLKDGTRNRPVGAQDVGAIETEVVLPKDLVCDRCVLRWHYRTGNSWGLCDDGTQNLGCGNQEIFRSCADIRILPSDNNDDDDVTDEPSDDNSDENDNVTAEPPNDDNGDDDNNDYDDNNGHYPDDRNPCFRPPFNPHHPQRKTNSQLKQRF